MAKELTPEERTELANWLKRQMAADNLTTDLIPAHEPSKRLMIVLHGLGDSMEGYRDVPQMLRIPWLNYLLVNAPDPYYSGYSWFDLNDRTPGVTRSRQLITGLLDAQREIFPSEQTILFGFSQGCLMSLETGLRYPHKLAGLIGVSGWVHDEDMLLNQLSPHGREVPILWTHGTRDALIPFAEVKDQAERLRVAGLKIQWEAFPKEHTFFPREIEVIRDFILKTKT
jgi:phospholipase/carboxylesterase